MKDEEEKQQRSIADNYSGGEESSMIFPNRLTGQLQTWTYMRGERKAQVKTKASVNEQTEKSTRLKIFPKCFWYPH